MAEILSQEEIDALLEVVDEECNFANRTKMYSFIFSFEDLFSNAVKEIFKEDYNFKIKEIISEFKGYGIIFNGVLFVFSDSFLNEFAEKFFGYEKDEDKENIKIEIVEEIFNTAIKKIGKNRIFKEDIFKIETVKSESILSFDDKIFAKIIDDSRAGVSKILKEFLEFIENKGELIGTLKESKIQFDLKEFEKNKEKLEKIK